MADYKVNGKIFTVDDADIKDIMTTESMTKEMAVRCYFEDMGIINTGSKDSITEVESKPQKRHYVKSNKERKPSTRTRKVDEEKKVLIEKLASVIDAKDKVIKTETEFSFSMNGNEYTVKLIKHRKKKE